MAIEEGLIHTLAEIQYRNDQEKISQLSDVQYRNDQEKISQLSDVQFMKPVEVELHNLLAEFDRVQLLQKVAELSLKQDQLMAEIAELKRLRQTENVDRHPFRSVVGRFKKSFTGFQRPSLPSLSPLKAAALAGTGIITGGMLVTAVIMGRAGATVNAAEIVDKLRCKFFANSETADISLVGDNDIQALAKPQSCDMPQDQPVQVVVEPQIKIPANVTPTAEFVASTLFPMPTKESTPVPTVTPLPTQTPIPLPTKVVEPPKDGEPTRTNVKIDTSPASAVSIPEVPAVQSVPQLAQPSEKPTEKQLAFESFQNQKISINYPGQTFWGALNVPKLLLSDESEKGWILGNISQEDFDKDVIVKLARENYRKGLTRINLESLQVGQELVLIDVLTPDQLNGVVKNTINSPDPTSALNAWAQR